MGDTLWNAPVPTLEQQQRLRALFDARRRAAAQPADLNNKLLVARRTAEMGRLQEAIRLYTEAIAAQPLDARHFRRRGELLLLTRELDQAIRDLRQAESAIDDTLASEYVEAEGGRILESNQMHTARWLLGIAYYVRGDHGTASKALTRSIHVASNADELAASALWLFFSLRREKRLHEAAEVLRAIPGTLPVLTRVADLTLLQLFKGEIPIDSLRARIAGPHDPAEEMLYFYGLGFTRLMQQRPEEAAGFFEQAMLTGQWTAIPYLAAEAELARLKRK